jgi:predicted GNAT family acetyltransferase
MINPLMKNKMENLLNVETPLSQSISEQIKDRKKEYMKNPLGFKMDMNKQFGSSSGGWKVKTVSFEDTSDNQLMEDMLDNFESVKVLFTMIAGNGLKVMAGSTIPDDELENYLDVEASMIGTRVNERMKFHPRICFSVGDAHLNIVTEGKKINISRVWVPKSAQGKGVGSILMASVMTILKVFNKGNHPSIVLECVGSVGMGENFLENTIEKQVKFFAKHGFVTYNNQYYKGQLVESKMKLNPNKVQPFVDNVSESIISYMMENNQ